MRKRLVRRLLWVLAFATLWLPLLPAPPLWTAPFLQNVTSTGATIAVVTAAPTSLRAQAIDADGAVVAAVTSSDRRRHRLRLEGLAAGATYRYEVTERGADGAQVGSLGSGVLRTTPTGDDVPVRFALLGDSGAQPWWVWLQTAPLFHLPARWHWLPPRGRVVAMGDAIAAADPAFVLHLGDIVYPKGRHGRYSSGFFRPFEAVLAKAPIYPALGNHDVKDTGGLQTLANLALPVGATTGDGRCYSFAYGPVRVICLDCTTEFAVNGRFDSGHPSYRFLQAELANRPEPWVIVATHYPVRSASRQGDRPDFLVDLVPLLEEFAVSLYLAGHDHCYQRFESSPDEPQSVPLVVSGGGGKSLYEIDVGWFKRKGGQAHDRSYHWCAVEIDGAVLRLRATDLEGREFDTFERKLPSGGELIRLRSANPGRATRIDAIE